MTVSLSDTIKMVTTKAWWLMIVLSKMRSDGSSSAKIQIKRHKCYFCYRKPVSARAQRWPSYCVMVGMLRDLFMMRRTSTSGRLSCLVWAHPSSAAAMCRSKRSDTDFFLSLGFPLKKEPSHCFITLSIFSVLVRDVGDVGNKRWICKL